MHRRMWLSVAMLAVGASMLVAAGFASPAESSPSAKKAKRGGTLRVNLPGTDIDDLDPSIAYGTTTWHIQYSTALKLLNYPDRPAPAGSRLVPEGATGYKVSNGGRVYTFTIAKGFKFSDGTAVTAKNYAYAFHRAMDKELQSPGFQFIADPSGSNIVGAQDVRDGKAATARGVRVKGNKLIITLTNADATFLAKATMPFFQAMSTKLPRTKKVISVASRNDLPSAGPYYVSFREPNRALTVKKNPFYKGKRPRNLDAINMRVQVNLEASYREVLANQADYTLGLPPTAAAELGRRFGTTKGQFRVTPSACVSYIAMNNDSPLFSNNAKLRRAVNFAINRSAMVDLAGAYAGKPHDQILPPGFPGFRNANIYPARPNLTQAKSLARGATRSGKGVYYYGLSGSGPDRMELVRGSLKQIGVDIEPKGFRGFAIYDAAGRRGSEHAFTTGGWCQDYPDPYNFVNVLLYGGNIQADNNNNLAYFNTPAYNKKMERASRLLGDARLKTYGALDIDISKNQAPWASWNNPNHQFFFGSRVDPKSFVFQPIYEEAPYNLLALK